MVSVGITKLLWRGKMSKAVYYNLLPKPTKVPICRIINDPCDNPLGCHGCYHQEVQDYHDYIGGGVFRVSPAVAVKRRKEKYKV